MGRRKIEIKAIKDDRNRAVTFLKRKGGLFKKAHELSVLCSVDVAVFIFGNNKKLYEYSSSDMNDLIAKYQYTQHGGPNEHKGPADFNGKGDDDEDEEGEPSPPLPQGEHIDHQHQMLPPQFHAQQPPFPQIRHHTPSASPPVGNGVPFGHPHHPQHPQRAHTPQPPPHPASRPSSRNDMTRPVANMMPQQHPVATYMPQPPSYVPQHPAQPPMPDHSHAAQYPYASPPPPPHQPPHQPPPQQQEPPPPPQHQRHYSEETGVPLPPPPPSYAQGGPQPHGLAVMVKSEVSPPEAPPGHLQPPPIPRISVSPQPDKQQLGPQPPPPPPPPAPTRSDSFDRPSRDSVKKLPQRKSHSIFTPIEENHSILSQHMASFQPSDLAKAESGSSMAAAAAANREAAKARAGHSSSPPQPQPQPTRSSSLTSQPPARDATSTTLPPPTRSNTGGGARPRGPPLTLQIPADEASEAGGSAAGESASPPPASATALPNPARNNSVVLPPPSPSHSTILSAGATGPPNPFARPVPDRGVNGEATPVSALPSRFLNHDFLPSPSSFYPPEWGFSRGGGADNTLPSPLNFATPVTAGGPSFLKEDTGTAGTSATSASGSTAPTAATSTAGAAKRKSPEVNTPSMENADPKRAKMD